MRLLLSLTRLKENMYPMMDMALLQDEGQRLKVKVTRSYYVKNRSAGLDGASCCLCLVKNSLTCLVIGQSQ